MSSRNLPFQLGMEKLPSNQRHLPHQKAAFEALHPCNIIVYILFILSTSNPLGTPHDHHLTLNSSPKAVKKKLARVRTNSAPFRSEPSFRTIHLLSALLLVPFGMGGSSSGVARRFRGSSSILLLAIALLICLASANVADLLVIGVDLDPSDPRAYPLEILNYHEIVNDVIGGRHVAITWSPLTYSNVIIETESLLRSVDTFIRLVFGPMLRLGS